MNTENITLAVTEVWLGRGHAGSPAESEKETYKQWELSKRLK